jgi:putative membrane protein
MQATKYGAPDRSKGDYLKLSFGGFLMGICEIIPGVSGGTMAFILGFYEEFIGSLKVLGDREFIRATTHLRIKEMFSILNWRFLLVLAIGMFIAIFSLAGLLGHLLENYATYIWSFFFGLVLASVFIVSRRIDKWRPSLIIAFIIATIVSFLLVGLVPSQTPDTWWFYILAGAVAICAMILPGVSGSFLLVIMGKYESVLNAVRTLDFGIIILVGIGAVLGLVTFAQVVNWLFKNYHNATIAVLTGLILGSLRRIWPWKEVSGVHDEVISNYMPDLTVNGAINTEVVAVIVLTIIGVIVMITLERFAAAK